MKFKNVKVKVVFMIVWMSLVICQKEKSKLPSSKLNAKREPPKFLLKERKQEPGNNMDDNENVSVKSDDMKVNANYDTDFKSQTPHNNTHGPSEYTFFDNFNPFPTHSDETTYFVVNNIQCNSNNCSPPNFCQDTTTCLCGEGRANLPKHNHHHFMGYCLYRQKQQIVAFLLETFLSMGTGHLYAARYTFALVKLFFCLVPFIMTCCIVGSKGKKFDCLVGIVGIFKCVFLIWQLIDIIYFATNSYRDGKGVPLIHW